MERFLPNFFILMILLWILGIYFSHDIVIKIQNEQYYNIHLQRLRGSLEIMLHRIANKTNNTLTNYTV